MKKTLHQFLDFLSIKCFFESNFNKILIVLIAMFIVSQAINADGGIGYKGIYVNTNGTKTWYKAHHIDGWAYNGCVDFQFNSASVFNSTNLGSFTSSQVFQIAGFAVVGWTNSSDWVAGKLLYKVWKQGDSEPGSWSEISVGNYGNGNGATQVVCSSGNDRVVGYNNGTTNINPGAPGTYNFKIQALGRMQWSGGSFNVNDGPEMTATFTITSSDTDNFRSKNTGNWNTSSTWESSSNGTNWATSTVVPGSTSASVTILNSHNVTLDQNVTVPSLTINSGATFTASDATPRTLTITKSSSGSSTTLSNSGTWANGEGGSTVVFSGAPSSGDAIHAITGTIAFQKVIINKSGGSSNVGAGFAANSSVSVSLEIGAGGYVSTNPPTSFYGESAVLKFNQGASANYDINPGDKSWSSTVIPNSITINSGTVTINEDRSATGTVIIDTGATLALSASKKLTVGTLTNNGTFTVKNGATVKTTTVTGSGTNNVEIQLAGSADITARQWWYVSSPVSAAKSSVFDAAGTNNLGWFNEEGTPPAYVQILNNTTDLAVGKGYLFQNKATATYTFTGGSLNNGSQPISLTRTGTTEGQRGFNLVGNPYPSYLDWKTAYDALSTSNIRSTIWYRTTTGTANGMKFITYNASTNIGTEGATRIVPPMQGFWMKVNQDGSGGSITFTNDMRSHATETANPLKAPAAGTNAMQLLRLKLSNGSVTDEAIMVGISGASDLVETFDSEKMANNSIEIPELYSFVGTQELAINSVGSLSAGRQFVLGFRPGKSGAFTIEANQFENITDDVYLVDQHTSTETKLSAGTVYNFTSDATATNDRFNVEFRAPGITTAVTEPNAANTFVFVNEAGQIGVQSAAGKDALISVYNTAGQQLASQLATGSVTLIQQSFSSGVYLVKVNNLLQKVVIN